MSLTNRAVIFELNISQFIGKKQDKKSSEEITNSKSATRNAASVSKHLFADVKELEDIGKFVSQVRRDFYEKTLPWADNGQRLVPMEIFLELNDWLSTQKVEFFRLVDDFVSKYNDLVSMQSMKLGLLFDPDEYPSAGTIRERFRFSVVCSPVPDSKDFRIEVEQSVKDALMEKYEQAFQERSQQAMRDLWTRLHTQLAAMSERLADESDGKSKIFRNSLVDNAVSLCNLLKDLNVENDPLLEEARQQLQETITGVTPDDLRNNKHIKRDVKARIDSLLANYSW